MQELGCSCKGRRGRKQVNLLSGSQFITTISEMGIGAWLMWNHAAAGQEVVLDQQWCPGTRVSVATSSLTAFLWGYFCGGEAHGKPIPRYLQPHQHVQTKPHKLFLLLITKV